MPTNVPFGFRPSRHLSGGVIRSNEHQIASAYATSIYEGDPVALLNDGTIGQAAAGDRLLGVFAGCDYVDSTGAVQFSNYWPASTTVKTGTVAKARVFDDKNIAYVVQSGGTPAQTNIGNLADHVVGTGSTVTGRSGAYLSSSMGTGAAGLRIHKIVETPGNSGQYALLEVSIYEHEYSVDEPATPGV